MSEKIINPNSEVDSDGWYLEEPKSPSTIQSQKLHFLPYG